MLRGIPKILSPEMLKVLCEMGHGDVLVIGDICYPAASTSQGKNLIRVDTVGNCELLDAILKFFPLDPSIDQPFTLMEMQQCDKDAGMEIPPIWAEYEALLKKYDPRGEACIQHIDRFEFYEKAKKAYATIATGEEMLYGCLMLQKGLK